MQKTLSLVEPVTLDNYSGIIADIDFGDQQQFLISCAQYVGEIKPRRKVILANGDPDVWEQRIVYEDNEYPLNPIGITGWYKWPPFAEPRIWLGWFGVRSQLQRNGFGRAILAMTIDEINRVHPNIEWLYVFTDSAVEFYQKCGFEKRGTCVELGMAGEVSPDSTFKDDDVILRLQIQK